MPPVTLQNTHTSRAICEAYASDVVDGRRVAGRWIYAAARRYLDDLERTDLRMDWEEVDRLLAFMGRLRLIGDYADTPFVPAPWQAWALSNLWGWRWSDDGRRRVVNGLLQVARGNGKTTLMAGLSLYDLQSAPGRRVHVIANREEQAEILLDTAKTMVRGLGDGTDMVCRQYAISRPTADSTMTALPAKESSLDGLTPSLWIADEAAEYRGRFLTKLQSAMAKRREALGVIISTPADNPDNIYGERVATAEAILKGELVDDSTVPMLYGIDPDDQLEDEETWVKANPGIEHGQPDLRSVRRSWATARSSAIGRTEFARYHACRMVDSSGGWLDMGLWPAPTAIDWGALRGRRAWIGLDLSKSLDLTALVVVVPLEDGRVALRGHYWWPDADVRQRELDYRIPVRTWAATGKVTLTPGREIDYEAIRATLKELADEFELQAVAYDKWGSKFFADAVVADGIPLVQYSQGISTMGPGCQLWQQFWSGGRLVIGDDPVMRNACRTAIAVRDSNGNIRVDKKRTRSIVDPLVAAIMGVHSWGGDSGTSWDFLLSRV